MSDHPEWHPLYSLGFDYPDSILARFRPKIVFDVGTNAGGYVDTWLKYGAEKVLCFEPIPDMAAKCRARYSDNPKVTVYEAGVSDEAVRKENLNVYNCWSLAGQGSRNDPAVEYKSTDSFGVDFIRLDDLIERPDFVKIDVDGYEFRVLKGMERILNEVKPPIYFEYSHLPETILKDSIIEMCRFIYDHGYVACSMKGWQCPSAKEMVRYFPSISSYDVLLMPNDLL